MNATADTQSRARAHVLVVDDDAHIREVIQFALDREGFSVTACADGAEARGALTAGGIDLLVLDILMPDVDGLSLCREVRARSRLPIIFLSSKTEETDRIVGLEIGGDDYMIKPFSPRELVARIRSVLRRAGERREPAERLRHGPLEIDVARHRIRVGGAPISMTATELALLRTILEEGGRVLTRADLIAQAYRFENHVTERTIDTHVKRIRAKLRPFGLAPIETVHGVGYRAAPPPP